VEGPWNSSGSCISQQGLESFNLGIFSLGLSRWFSQEFRLCWKPPYISFRVPNESFATFLISPFGPSIPRGLLHANYFLRHGSTSLLDRNYPGLETELPFASYLINRPGYWAHYHAINLPGG